MRKTIFRILLLLGCTLSCFQIHAAIKYSNGQMHNTLLQSGDSTTLKCLTNEMGNDTLSKKEVNNLNGLKFNKVTKPLAYSPGAVSANLALWMRGDYRVTGTTNVTKWEDYAAGRSATAATGPTLQTTSINFNPSLQFNGSNQSMIITGGIFGSGTYNDANVYVVGHTNVISASVAFDEHLQPGSDEFRMHMPWTDNFIYWDAGGNAAPPNRLRATWDGTVGLDYIWTLNYGTAAASTPYGHNQDIARNGLNLSNDNTAAAFTGNNDHFRICSNGTTNYFNGNIGELIVYTGAITALEQQRILSYLAIKYGLTLTNNNDADATVNEIISGTIREGDYVASDGSTVTWTYTANAGYTNNVAGIGRDDQSALNQKISASNSITPDIITISLDNDFISSNIAPARVTNFSNDKTFVVWGHNNGATTFSVAEGIGNRMARLWKQQETATVSTPKVYIKFTDSHISDNTSYYLIASNTTTTNSFILLATDTSAASGNTIIFGPVDITTQTFFTIADVPVPLPIELIKFTAKVNKEMKVDLNWITASELNNDYFTIERSKDGISFQKISEMKGAGNSSSLKNYSFVDNSPLPGISYYRLKQTDYNGKFSYSKFECITINKESEFSVKVFPNPNNGEDIYIFINSQNHSKISVTIYDIAGTVCFSKDFTAHPTNIIVASPSYTLAPGVYLIKTRFENSLITHKLIVQY